MVYNSPIHISRNLPSPQFRNTRRGVIVFLLILVATFTGQDVQAQGSRPSRPMIDVGSSPGQATVYWREANDPSITKWQYQYKIGSAAYGAWTDVPDSYARTYSYTLTGLSNDTTVYFKVRAVNANGASQESIARSSAVYNNSITMSTSSTAPIVEGNSGLKNVSITVSLSSPAPRGGLRIGINNMATSTIDRGKPLCSNRATVHDVCGPTSVTISAGATSATYTLSIIGDTVDENNETVYLKAVAAKWSRGTLRLVIADDEGGTATPTPARNSNTPAPTATSVPPTATRTHTGTPAPTATSVPPTATHTHTGTPAPTATSVPPTATHTHTGTPAPTATSVPPTATHTPVPPTNTPTGTRNSVAIPLFEPTNIHTPVPTRIRLYYRRLDDGYTPVATRTPGGR